jgi:hypothetical protein
VNELKDYSGPLIPDLKYDDFSKDCLMRLMRQYSAAYFRLAEFWYIAAKEVVGMEQALKMEVKVWERMSKPTLLPIAKTANIQVNDIVDVLKVLQVAPDSVLRGGIYTPKYDIKNKNHVIYSITRCGTLEWLEKNDPERITPCCHVLEWRTFEEYIKAFLPNVEVKALKLPPRKGPDEMACQWELTLKTG